MHLWDGVQHSRVQVGSQRVNHIFNYRNMPASLPESLGLSPGAPQPNPVVTYSLSAAVSFFSFAFSFPLCGVTNYQTKLQRAQKPLTVTLGAVT